MKTPEISIIIPAYNAQDTIVKCLDSIMHQDNINDFEVIVVNDGSTDNTSNIVQEYRYNRSNIELVNLLRNRGISVARNSGMRLAKGRFITFVDADDMVGVSADALQTLMNRPGAEHNSISPMQLAAISYPDVANFVPAFNTQYFTNMLRVAHNDTNIVLGGKLGIDMRNNIIVTYKYDNAHEFDLRPSEKSRALRNAYMRESANFALYERQFLENNRIKFQPAITLDEDILFCMQAVLHAKTIITAPDVMYMYTRHNNSASTPENYWTAYDLSTVQHLSVFLKDMYQYPEYNEIFYQWLTEFKAIGQIAGSRRANFPNMTCNTCKNDNAARCFACKRLQKLIDSNIRTLVQPQKQK